MNYIVDVTEMLSDWMEFSESIFNTLIGPEEHLFLFDNPYPVKDAIGRMAASAQVVRFGQAWHSDDLTEDEAIDLVEECIEDYLVYPMYSYFKKLGYAVVQIQDVIYKAERLYVRVSVQSNGDHLMKRSQTRPKRNGVINKQIHVP